ncbi:MAG: c-type cytochrome domain-containing protein [Verrucomicrobiota bacterium]
MSRGRRQRYRSRSEVWFVRLLGGGLVGLLLAVGMLLAKSPEDRAQPGLPLAKGPEAPPPAQEGPLAEPKPSPPPLAVVAGSQELSPKPVPPEQRREPEQAPPVIEVAAIPAQPAAKEKAAQEKSPAASGPAPPPSPARSISYQQEVVPVLQAHCYGCHGAEKDKGGLRLHTPEVIRAGGRYGEVVVAGDPERSSLYYLTILPADDPDVMPGKGEVLSLEQTEILRKWVEQGADMEDGQSLIPVEKTPSVPSLAQVETGDLRVPDAQMVARLRESGFLIKAITPDGRLLYLSGSHREERLGPEEVAALNALAPNLHSLDLSRVQFAAEAEIQWKTMSRVRELRLQRSGADDQTLLALAQGAFALEYLNLYDTPITDEGLQHLEKLTGLQEVYLWQSDASSAGVAALREALPDAKIDRGDQAG